jgi:hypothetical protein
MLKSVLARPRIGFSDASQQIAAGQSNLAGHGAVFVARLTA